MRPQFSSDIDSCATRFVLSDELTRLCTALAYSKGASTLACADLLHVPAERVWVEWTEAPWRNELARYGFKSPVDSARLGRRGVFIQSTPQGRRGLLRTFWASGESELNVLSSSMEAYFDFDTREGEDPEVFGRQQAIFDLRIGRCRRGCGYLAALLSIPFRALLAGLLREGTVDLRTSRRPSSSRTGYDSDRYTRVAGILFAPRYSSRPAASASDARAPQQSAGKVRKSGASRTDRGLCPASAGVQIRVQRRFRGISASAQASPCARPSRATGQQAFLAGARTCAAVHAPDPFGSARSLGSSIRRSPRRAAAAIRSNQPPGCLERRTAPGAQPGDPPSGWSIRRSTSASSRPTAAW